MGRTRVVSKLIARKKAALAEPPFDRKSVGGQYDCPHFRDHARNRAFEFRNGARVVVVGGLASRGGRGVPFYCLLAY